MLDWLLKPVFEGCGTSLKVADNALRSIKLCISKQTMIWHEG